MAQEDVSVFLKVVDEMSAPMNRVASTIEGLQSHLLGMAAGFISLEVAASAFRKTIDMADRIQDVTRSLEVFGSSATAAAGAITFFEEAQKKTRSTALELTEMYAHHLPIAIRQGWSEARLQDITLQLDRLAAAARVAPEAMQRGFDQLAMGRISARNPMLQALGLLPQDLKDAGENAGQALVDALTNKLAKLGDIPDSFQSMMHKITEDMEAALGKGFIEQLTQGSKAMEGFKKTFQDPAFIQALTTIGNALGFITIQASYVLKGVGVVVNDLKTLYDIASKIAAWGHRNSGDGGPGPSGGGGGGWDSSAVGGGGGWSDTLAAASGVGNIGPGGKGGKPAAELKQLATETDKVSEELDKMLRKVAEASVSGSTWGQITYANRAELKKLYDQILLYNIAIDDDTAALLRAGIAAEDFTKKLPGTSGFGDNQKFTESLGKFMDSQPAGSFGEVFSPVLGAWVFTDGTIDASKQQELINRLQVFTDQNQQLTYQTELANQKKLAQQINQVYQQDIVRPFSDALSAALSGDGKAFGNVMQQVLRDATKDFGTNIVGGLREAFKSAFGFTPDNLKQNSDGTYTVGGQNYSGLLPAQQAQQNQGDASFNRAAGGALSVGAGVYSLIQQKQAGTITPLSGALTGLSAGATFGVVGAVIGAFVGAVVGLILEAQQTIQMYARPMIKDGRAQLSDIMGMSPQDQRDWLQKIQAQWDTFRNGYVQIFLDMPQAARDAILPQLRTALLNMATGQYGGAGGPTGNGAGGSYYQDANGDWHQGTQGGGPTVGGLNFPVPINSGGADQTTPAVFQKWMSQWIDGTLPQSMMEQFKPVFGNAFEAMGVTIDKFKEIWKNAEGMDPKAAEAYLASYLGVVTNLHDIMAKIEQPVNFGKSGGLWADLQGTNSQTFVQELQTTDAATISQGQGLAMLTGQAQINEAVKLNTLIANRYQVETQYLQSLIQLAKSATDQLQNNLLSLQLNGKTTQQQYNILKDFLGTQESGFGKEKTAASLTTDYNSIVATVMRMANMFPNDPGIQTWAQSQLKLANDTYQKGLAAFGNAIDIANNSFARAMAPIQATLTSVLSSASLDFGNASAAVKSLDSAASSAAASVTIFRDAIDSASASIKNSNFASSARSSRLAAAA